MQSKEVRRASAEARLNWGFRQVSKRERGWDDEVEQIDALGVCRMSLLESISSKLSKAQLCTSRRVAKLSSTFGLGGVK
jgi:hypothetical protein